MTKGAIEIFADGSELEGEPFGWIEVLGNLGNPDFTYGSGHPLENIISESTPYELAKIVDCAVIKYRLDLKGELKNLQRLTQSFAVECMVNQAYTAGARELLFFGIQEGAISNESAIAGTQKIESYRKQSWRQAAKHAAILLRKIEFHVKRKGMRGQPSKLQTLGNGRSRIDEELLTEIDELAQRHNLIDRDSTKYKEFMLDNLTLYVKKFVREGKYDLSNPYEYQASIDAHALRLRRRLKAHFERANIPKTKK